MFQTQHCAIWVKEDSERATVGFNFAEVFQQFAQLDGFLTQEKLSWTYSLPASTPRRGSNRLRVLQIRGANSHTIAEVGNKSNKNWSVRLPFEDNNAVIILFSEYGCSVAPWHRLRKTTQHVSARVDKLSSNWLTEPIILYGTPTQNMNVRNPAANGIRLASPPNLNIVQLFVRKLGQCDRQSYEYEYQ